MATLHLETEPRPSTYFAQITEVIGRWQSFWVTANMENFWGDIAAGNSIFLYKSPAHSK